MTAEIQSATSAAEPGAALRLPLGAVSPFWSLYAGAAVSGMAWWWMTRWAQPQNLEALFGKMPAAAPSAPEPLLAAALEPAATAVEYALDVAAAPLEAVADAFTETASVDPEPAAEQPLSEAVGGESAPMAPVLAAAVDEPAHEPVALRPAVAKMKKPSTPAAD